MGKPVPWVMDRPLSLWCMPDFSQPSFKLGEWEITCRRVERDDDRHQYAWVGPLADETKMDEIQETFRTLDGVEYVELTWIPQRLLSRTTMGRWLRLKVKGLHRDFFRSPDLFKNPTKYNNSSAPRSPSGEPTDSIGST